MTLEQAKGQDEGIPNFKVFASKCCDSCTSEDYCPSYCDMLSKAEKMHYEKIVQSYAKHDGDLVKVSNYIKRYKDR
ncbi:hypothetical protein C8E03_11934 [Lachnotalea glycerini]|uniref:Uncharacterized protein n=1 Tax=Lachnotalea glycerini TaxID=1763509 RepID=A0A255IQB8_9FIRM|nr:hypothetical protein [Lachnotalea glycerini]PXV85110.1 hypothetical protein C8E03_11934 [Lachnotalea glycerini]RDY30172.1 hypothetical protein CG710_016175 [Lachnotalea glycerini]